MSTDGTWCQVRKFVGSQLWSTTYRIKKAECYEVPMDASPSLSNHTRSARFDSNDKDDTSATGLTTIDTHSSSHTHTSTVPDHRRCLTSAHPTTSARCCLFSSFSFQYRYQPYILTISMQPARPGRRAQMTHRHTLHSAIPRGLCIVLVYPSRPCHYKR